MTVIDAVATSPWTPPAIFIDSRGLPSTSTESYGLRRAQIRLHVQLDDRLAFDVAGAVLNQAAHLARLDGQELARDRRLRDLRRDHVGHLVQLPAHRVRDHRNRFGEADVPDAPVIHPRLELRGREAAADLLLERQAARTRVLDPVDRDRVTDSQTPVSVIGSASIVKPGLTPVPSTATFAFLAAASMRAREAPLRELRIRELLGRRDDRHLQREDAFDLRPHLLQRGARAQHHDVRLRRLDCRARVGRHLDAQPSIETDNLAEIAAHLRRIDVDAARRR